MEICLPIRSTIKRYTNLWKLEIQTLVKSIIWYAAFIIKSQKVCKSPVEIYLVNHLRQLSKMLHSLNRKRPNLQMHKKRNQANLFLINPVCLNKAKNNKKRLMERRQRQQRCRTNVQQLQVNVKHKILQNCIKDYIIWLNQKIWCYLMVRKSTLTQGPWSKILWSTLPKMKKARFSSKQLVLKKIRKSTMLEVAWTACPNMCKRWSDSPNLKVTSRKTISHQIHPKKVLNKVLVHLIKISNKMTFLTWILNTRKSFKNLLNSRSWMKRVNLRKSQFMKKKNNLVVDQN